MKTKSRYFRYTLKMFKRKLHNFSIEEQFDSEAFHAALWGKYLVNPNKKSDCNCSPSDSPKNKKTSSSPKPRAKPTETKTPMIEEPIIQSFQWELRTLSSNATSSTIIPVEQKKKNDNSRWIGTVNNAIQTDGILRNINAFVPRASRFDKDLIESTIWMNNKNEIDRKQCDDDVRLDLGSYLAQCSPKNSLLTLQLPSPTQVYYYRYRDIHNLIIHDNSYRNIPSELSEEEKQKFLTLWQAKKLQSILAHLDSNKWPHVVLGNENRIVDIRDNQKNNTGKAQWRVTEKAIMLNIFNLSTLRSQEYVESEHNLPWFIQYINEIEASKL